MRHTMRRQTNCFYFSVSFSFCIVLVAANYTTAGYGDEFVEDEVTQRGGENATENISGESTGSVEDLSLVLKMATLCETPNHDPGLCIEIKECPLLLHQLNNTEARQFLRDSHCGPQNENRKNPKVCCGRYNNYRKVSKNIVEDNCVFPKSCGIQKMIIRGRIIGGKEASLGEYPWMVRLIHKNKYGYKSFGCSGFLIHVKYVITAGHCTHPDLIQIRGPVYSVTLGEHNTETMIDCSPGGTFCAEPRQISRAEKVIVHPDYDPKSLEHVNDIAIIHLKKGARLSDYVKPICLPIGIYDEPTTFYLSGWGKTENASSSKIKMKVELQPFDKQECKEKYSLLNIDLRETQICAGGQGKKDSCTGDSGGPLMVSINGTFYASGIVSYGIGCARKGWPGVYTDVSQYIPWIEKQILLNSMLSARSNKARRRHRKNKGVKKN